ncbi:MAG: hypothetical protein RL026_1953 [Pseudomonadota bacterium]
MSNESISGDRSTTERSALALTRELVDHMARIYRDLERATGAPIALHRALSCIVADPGVPASTLARRLGVHNSAVSQLLRGLEARGWVERRRAPEDQRTVRLFATEAGSAIEQATHGPNAVRLQDGVRRLTDPELRALMEGAAALLRALR